MRTQLLQRFVPALVFAQAGVPALSVELTARAVEASSARRAAGHHHAVITP